MVMVLVVVMYGYGMYVYILYIMAVRKSGYSTRSDSFLFENERSRLCT